MSDGKLNAVNQQITVPDSSEPGIMLRRSYCARHKQRIRELGVASASAWSTAGWALASVGASATVAVLALPKNDATLPTNVKTVLWSIAIGAIAMTVVCGLAHLGVRKRRKGMAEDIISEFNLHAGDAPGEPSSKLVRSH